MVEIVEFLGGKYEVLSRYEISEKEMKDFDLYYKSRITLKNVDTGEVIDCANSMNI